MDRYAFYFLPEIAFSYSNSSHRIYAKSELKDFAAGIFAASLFTIQKVQTNTQIEQTKR